MAGYTNTNLIQLKQTTDENESGFMCFLIPFPEHKLFLMGRG